MTELDQACRAFLRFQRAQGNRPKTVSNYECFLTQWITWLKRQGHSGDLADLTGASLRDWLAAARDQGNGDKTILTKAIHVKAFTAWLADEGEYLDQDPCAKVKRPRADNLAKPTLTLAQIETLLGACPQTTCGRRDKAILLLIFSTGLRTQELLDLTAQDLDLAQGQITIQHSKAHQFRVVPLSPPVERALTKYLQDPRRRSQPGPTLFLTQNGTPLSASGFRMIFRRLEVETGIHCNPHKWRHTAAIEYLRGGGKIETLKALLGHQSLVMTLHYARQAGIDIRTAHDLADPVNRLRRP